jgi:hypothetical protein
MKELLKKLKLENTKLLNDLGKSNEKEYIRGQINTLESIINLLENMEIAIKNEIGDWRLEDL